MESQIRMMRTMQTNSALPVTRNMPYISASVPSRNQPRNMTGIYLGLEGNINPPQNRGSTGLRVRKGTSAKIRTPAEDRRYKMVELLRVKEEKRGFKGQPLKRRQSQPDEENVTPKCSHNQQLQHRKWGPAKSANPTKFDDVIKQNPRHYTAIINSGVTRSENLTGLMSFAEHYGWDITNMALPDALIEEVQRSVAARDDLAGLEECFKKVCKGNPESLHSLLPLRRGTARADNYTTGFTVRSYRNPNKAELLADFDVHPMQHGRPKTVPATMYSNSQSRQPLVPAPYFFKYYNTPSTAHSNKKRNSPSSQAEDQQSLPQCSDKIIGLPGSGVISRSLKNGRMTAWSEGDGSRIRRGTPREDSPTKDPDRHHLPLSSRNDTAPTNSQPLEIRAEGYPLNSDDKPLATDRSGISEPASTSRSEAQIARGKSKTSSNKGEAGVKGDKSEDSAASRSNNNMDGRGREHGDTTIRLDLETADGKKQEIFLDDSEFTNTGKNELQRKLSEAKVASIQEGARKKKKDFEQILDEHAQIVTTISRQSSSESSNEAFQNAQNERDQ